MFPKYWAGLPSLPLADSQGEETRPQDQVLALVAQIWDKSKERIVARIDTLEQATIELLDGRLDLDLRREAEREAHKLAGSLTTFGFPEGSRLARDIEQSFQADSPLGPKDALHLSEKVVTLRQALEREATQPTSQPPDHPTTTGYRLLVVDDDREVIDRLSADAPAKGLDTEFASSLAEAREAVSRHRPAVVLLNLSIPGAKTECLAFIAELSSGNPPIPVLVRTPLDATLDRVQVAKSGGRGFLPHSLPPPLLLDAVCGVLGQKETGKVIGTAEDCLSDMTPVGDGLSVTGTTFFNFTEGGTLISRGETSVQPTTIGSDAFTHITGAIPAPGSNQVIGGTESYQNVTGTVRLSGAVNLSLLESDGKITFDCIFQITLHNQ